MAGFTKLDEGILQSSVMSAPPVTFKVWIALLAACRSDGVARVSPTYLGAVCRLSPSDVGRALEELASPDPNSRSTTEEGRRIARVDGGFRLINYHKYRNLGIREAESAARVERRRRSKDEAVRTGSGQGPDPSASPSASASAEGGAGGDRGRPFYRPPRQPRISERIDLRRALCQEYPQQRGETLDAYRQRIDALLERETTNAGVMAAEAPAVSDEAVEEEQAQRLLAPPAPAAPRQTPSSTVEIIHNVGGAA